MKNFFDYKAYIFDMDGTLYFKRPMQLRMAWQLGRYYLLHPHRVKELLVIRAYRKLREREDITGREGFETVIRRRLAGDFSMSESRVDSVVDNWMLLRPLMAVAKSRDKTLLRQITQLQNLGKAVFVYSDYPAKDKCRAIGLKPQGIYWPDGVKIRKLKPEPDGLRCLLEENGLAPEDVLFVGDRQEKDGKCAAAMGVDAWILAGDPLRRKKQYEEMNF